MKRLLIYYFDSHENNNFKENFRICEINYWEPSLSCIKFLYFVLVDRSESSFWGQFIGKFLEIGSDFGLLFSFSLDFLVSQTDYPY